MYIDTDSDIVILNVKGSNYHCIISGISKSEAMKLLQNIYAKAYTKMKKKIKFCDIEIQTRIFLRHKKPISLKEINIGEIVVCHKISFGKK